MIFDTTYGNLKKRIFDILDEYSSDSDTVFVSDTDKALITSKLSDAVNSSLVRMYESLPIGLETAVQRILTFLPIAHDRGIPDGDRTVIEFETPTANLAVFFRYFGNGKVSFYDQSGKVVGTVDCAAASSLAAKRTYLSFASTGLYSVRASANLKILDFCVYANDGKTVVNALCGINEVSFELPQKFERLILAEGEYGNIDPEKIQTDSGFAFVQKGTVGTAESICIKYKKTPDVITESTEDSFVFELSPLAFEALVCLTASYLCREQDAGKYTRLVYKYNDLCEGLRTFCKTVGKRNTFYRKTRSEMRW